jgi:hypothetical protein
VPSNHGLSLPVPTFATARDAKEFLANRIVSEAQRENVPLSEIEQKMLYFSETHWAPPDIWETNEAFDRDYDPEEYEQKIGSLIRNLIARDRKENQGEYATWKEAVGILDREDHYLLVLIDVGRGSPYVGNPGEPSLSFVKLLTVVLVTLAVIAAVMLVQFWFKGWH